MSAKKVFANIERKVANLMKKVRLKDYGDEAINRIQKRTRLGYGVTDGERGKPRYKLPALSTNYKKARKKRKLDQTTKPGKSNLTRTGQLLRALRSRVFGQTIQLYIKPDRNDGIDNKDLLEWQADKGRHFFELTDKEVKGLRNQLKKDLIKLLKK